MNRFIIVLLLLIPGMSRSQNLSFDGTGDVALITFRPTLVGQSQVQFTAESELLDPQDVPIEIKGLGTGVVNAQ